MRSRYVAPLMALAFTPVLAVTAQSQTPTRPGGAPPKPGAVNTPGGAVKELGATAGPQKKPKASKAELVPPTDARKFVDREVIVDFRNAASAAERQALRDSVGAVKSRKIGDGDFEVLTLKAGASEAGAVKKLDRSAKVEVAALNGISYADATPNDPYYPQQWNLHNLGDPTIPGGLADADIDAPEAWDLNIGSTGVKVGIMDTGVDMTNADISPNLYANPGETGGVTGVDDDNNGWIDDVHGWDFALNNNDPSPVEYHGTAVASVAAGRGNDNTGVTGVAQRASIVPLQIFSEIVPGSSSYTVNDADVIEAIQYADDEGLDVVNGSWSGPGYNPAVESAFADADDLVYVATAGNTGQNVDDNPRYPCAYEVDNIICVGSTDKTDNKASSSGWGVGNVDLAAPGVLVPAVVTDFSSGYGLVSGTSFAAPAVAGAIAVLKAANPTWTPAQLKQRILSTVDRPASLAGTSRTEGRLNLDKALRNVPSPARPAGAASVVSGELRLTGGTGASNEIIVSATSTAYVVEDLLSPITPSSGCTAVTTSKVSCAKTGITSLNLSLGDGYNSASVPVKLPLTYTGGSSIDRVTAGYGSANITTGGGNDRVYGGTGNDTISTGAGTDTVYGGLGDDAINAGDDKDIVAGDEGDDTISLGAGNDQTVTEREAGDDTIHGDAGEDWIFGGEGIDELYGDDDNDVIEASTGDSSTVSGGNGDDFLRSAAGRQTFSGDAGTDTISYQSHTTGVTIKLNNSAVSGVSGENDTILSDIENVVGSPYADTIVGSAANNSLDGADGADNVSGGDGNDVLEAGSPDLAADVYAGGNGTDTIDYAPTDYMTSARGVSVSLDGTANDGIVSLGEADNVLNDIENIAGTDAADRLDGNASANVLTGRGGDDVLIGRAGTDTYDGGANTDTVSYTDKTVAINVSLDGAANDGQSGEVENVGSTIEKVVGTSQADTLSSSVTGTTLDGAAGADSYTTGDGDQTILARDGVVDTISACGNGVDSVKADTTDAGAVTACETVLRDPYAEITTTTLPESGQTNDTTPTFSFTAPASSGVTFKCRVGTGSGVPAGTGSTCTSPYTPGPLADGWQTVAIQAYVGATASGPVATRSFLVDTELPVSEPGWYGKTLYAGEPRSIGMWSLVQFGWDGYENRCKVDGGAYKRCGPRSFAPRLSEGIHTFKAEAQDEAGNVDPNPGEAQFLEQHTPQTELEAGPVGDTFALRPKWWFDSPDADTVSYQCRIVPLDGGDVPAFEPCSGSSSHQPASNLAEGAYRFEVRARDTYDYDPTPLSFEVVVKAPRWGFVWNDSPASASLTPAATKQGSSVGGTNSITRAATGDYTVTFANLGSGLRGNAQVRATGTSGNRCNASQFGGSSGSATVRVRCVTAAGVAADTPFVAAFQVNESIQPLDAGYAMAMSPTDATYEVSDVLSANSTGDVNQSTRFSTGTYALTFGSFGGAGVPVVTAVSPTGANVTCQITDISVSVSVQCNNGAGANVDSIYSVTFADSSVFTKRRGAYIFANNATATTAYTPASSSRFWNSQTGSPTSRKVTTGQYEVILPGHSPSNAIPLVTAYATSTPTHCWAASWAASGANTAVQVRCTNAAGTLADGQFTLSYASSTA